MTVCVAVATKRRKSARLVFAENMRARRLELGLSQEELADGSALHRTYIGSVERGERNVSIDNMERIAKALDAALSEMLTDAS